VLAYEGIGSAHGRKIILLLAAYDKGKEPSVKRQNTEIKRAKQRLTKFDEYIREVEQQAKAGGPEAAARWDAFNAHYAMAREVRELRRERKLTQKQLAAGIDQGEISRIERGQTNPTAATLAALLAPLNARLGVVRRNRRDLAHA
jgi:DNA-binding XRE family transcriptional regulator